MRAALSALVGPGEPLHLYPVDDVRLRQASLSTPVDLETTALLALGIGVAMVAAVIVVLVLRTEQRLHDRDVPELRALGFTEGQLTTLAAVRTWPVAVAGAAIALIGSVGLSSRFPIGIGRQLELDPGLEVNVEVLAVGALAIVVLVIVVGMVASRSRRARETNSRSTVTGWLRTAGAPTEAGLGAHFAFEGSNGRRSTTTLQGMLTAVVALVVVGAVGMWVGGESRLYDIPADHGWPWDVSIGNSSFALAPTTLDRLGADASLTGQTRATSGMGTLDEVPSELFAIDADGTAPPVVLSGRLPVAAREVALGSRVLDRLGAGLGSIVTLSVAGGEFDTGGQTTDIELTVVGTALAPQFGDSDIGEVSVVIFDAIRDAGGDPAPQLVMARVSGTDRATAMARLSTD